MSALPAEIEKRLEQEQGYGEALAQYKKSSKKEALYHAWEAYLKELDEIEKEIVRKTKSRYSLEKRLPKQALILQLSKMCFELTEAIHGIGNGNFSAFYVFFNSICEKAQTTFYAYEDLQPTQSRDGFITVFNEDLKNSLSIKYMSDIQKPFSDQGGLWAGGRSAIDNAILSTVMSIQESRTLLLANGLKRFMLRFLQREQAKILEKYSKNLGYDLKEGRADSVKNILLTSVYENEKYPSTLAFDLLQSQGKLIEDWGQVPESRKKILWDWSKSEINRTRTSQWVLPQFERFLKFTKTRPGDFIPLNEWDPQGTETNTSLEPSKLKPKQLHWLAQTTGLWSNQIGVLSRKSVENLTPIRYFPVHWVRTCALEDIDRDGKRILIRPINSQEISRIRSNQVPYFQYHSMSMSTSGFPEALGKYSLLYDLGIPIDSGASLDNLSCDIEKIFQEAKLTGAQVPPAQLLPRENYLAVGQNPINSSSIPQTQHTHISQSTLSDFPIYQRLAASLTFETGLDERVEVVQVGERVDAFYLRTFTTQLIDNAFIRFFVDLRMFLLEKFKGSQNVDLQLHAIPDGHGKFAVIFAPISRRTIKRDLPLECVNLAQGAGIWGISYRDHQTKETLLAEGEPLLRKLWDYSALEGSRAQVITFLEERVAAKSLITNRKRN